MSNRRYASWVKGEYLLWAKEQQDNDKHFQERAIYRFLTNGYSKPVLKTLRAIAEAEPQAKMISLESSPGYIGFQALQIADTLLNQLESYYFDFDINTKKAAKKQLMPVLGQWKSITTKLFNILHPIHIYKASDLIKGTSDLSFEEVQTLTFALKSLGEKTAQRALLEFADEIESLANGNPSYVLNNRAPTETQARIQLVVNLIIYMTDINATKELSGLADLIIYLIEIINEHNEMIEKERAKETKDDLQLCPRDVAPLIKSIIENYESLQNK